MFHFLLACWWEVIRISYFCSLICHVSFFSGCFFFVFSNLIIITRCGFLYVYPAWGLLRFWNLWVDIFDQFLKYLGHYFLPQTFIFWEFKYIYIKLYDTVPQNTEDLVFSTVVVLFYFVLTCLFFSLFHFG